jgi:hypothetical protein
MATERGNKMRAIKKQGEYRLYRVENHLELWKGVFGGEYSYRAGYVANAENFEYAIDVAEEEMRCLMAEAI